MTHKIAILMDPIGKINIKKDSSFAMLVEAKKRKHQLYYLEQSDLMLKDGCVHARVRRLDVFEDPTKWYQLEEPEIVPLHSMDSFFGGRFLC